VPTLSICCLGTRPGHVERAAAAVARTAAAVRADCVYWFSNSPFPAALPGIDIVATPVELGFGDFFADVNQVFLRLMPLVVATDFTIVVQWDGFAVNAAAWDERFLRYDYIGACWIWMWGGGRFSHWHGPMVGNGGFSLRSRRLLDALLELDLKSRIDQWPPDDPRLGRQEYVVLGADQRKYIPEDILISLWYRRILKAEFGIRFCPPRLANKFSVETVGRYTQSWLGRSFGFHGIMAAPHYGVCLTP
jgi:Protein of unknown function (DUF5672)